MVDIYEKLRDEKGVIVPGRTILFITKLDGYTISEFIHGQYIAEDRTGILLVVDDYIANQVEKLLYKDGQLVVKEGMTIDIPEKSALEIEKEELLMRLAELEKI